MAEVLVTFPEGIVGSDGRTYLARACGSVMDDSRWQGWIEFEPIDGGPPLRSGRETTQPNRADTAYWGTGLTPVYLEGALERTLKPGPVPGPKSAPVSPAFDGPAPSHADGVPPINESVLNPFSVYRKGEALLRRQLSALAGWHLVNIIRAYELSTETPDQLNTRTPDELIEIIVAAVKTSEPDLVEP
jgi:hypothetical protein